jgi:hypothetical protein
VRQQQRSEAYQARQRQWREKNPGYHRKNAYGLSEQDYWRMLVAQNNACKICKQSFDEKRKPHIDHDHQTGKVRGILCPQCNHGLGLFEDNPLFLRAAADYLEKQFP